MTPGLGTSSQDAQHLGILGSQVLKIEEIQQHEADKVSLFFSHMLHKIHVINPTLVATAEAAAVLISVITIPSMILKIQKYELFKRQNRNPLGPTFPM